MMKRNAFNCGTVLTCSTQMVTISHKMSNGDHYGLAAKPDDPMVFFAQRGQHLGAIHQHPPRAEDQRLQDQRGDPAPPTECLERLQHGRAAAQQRRMGIGVRVYRPLQARVPDIDDKKTHDGIVLCDYAGNPFAGEPGEGLDCRHLFRRL